MTPDALKSLLETLARGDISVAEVTERIRHLPFTDVDGARVDHHRELRTGIPEVVFGEGKSAEQIVTIVREMVHRSGAVLITRIEADKASRLLAAVDGLEYFPEARIVMRRRASVPLAEGLLREGSETSAQVALISAGTSDQPVAEEAARTLEFLGWSATRYRDLGVSGLHRLLAERENIAQASVVIVVAGMEGALPSVVGGLVDVPVIAVPTSIGYGASFGGITAMFAMMNSCAPGVTVVNIDNGFGAAVAAAAMLRLARRGS